MRIIKRLRHIAAALALALLLSCAAGCARSAQSAPYRVWLIAKSTTTEFWKSVFAGANVARSEYNIDLTIVGAENEEAYEDQNNLIRQAIHAGADAIIFSAISYTENASAIDAAASAGIRIVIIDSDVDSGGVSARIGTDNVAAGRIMGEAVLDTEQTRLVVGIVNCFAETQNCQERELGFREALLTDERVSGIYTVNVQTDAREAQHAAERLLRNHPEINVLVGFNEPLAVGVAQAIYQQGLAEAVRGVVFDTNPRCVELLHAGVLSALIVQNPYAMGYLGVETAWQLLQGERLDANTLIDTATRIVTRANMFTMESQKALFPFD